MFKLKGDAMTLERKLKMGMVGGGKDAFIGGVHRRAALMDGKIELAAGALSSDPARAAASARELMLPAERSYGTYTEMAEAESKKPPGERIDFVSIVTPNKMHFPVARTFAELGIHIICDKPMTYSLAEAKQLVDVVETSGIVFGLTHNYTGYPMVKQARHMVQNGQLGEILKIVVEYPQGWLLAPIEQQGQKQAAWRTDPTQAGVSNCMGDIGSHCHNLAHYITGLELTEICADLKSILDRPLDNDGNILLRFDNGACGILYASQFSAGEENNLRIRVYGTKAALEWHQEEPNHLWFRTNEGPAQLYRRGNGYLCEAARRATRLPAGHPEAFIEAFANIYMNVTDTIRAKLEGREPTALELDFPTVVDGARGLAFIESAVESGQSDQKWYPMKRYN
jgi:predicted dehydrogenase